MCVAHVCSCLPNSFASGSAEVLEYLSSGLLYIVIIIVFLRFPVYEMSARKKLHSRTLLFFNTIYSWHVPVKQPTRKLRYSFAGGIFCRSLHRLAPLFYFVLCVWLDHLRLFCQSGFCFAFCYVVKSRVFEPLDAQSNQHYAPLLNQIPC